MTRTLTAEDLGYIYQATIMLHKGDACSDCYAYGVKARHCIVARIIYEKIKEEWNNL